MSRKIQMMVTSTDWCSRWNNSCNTVDYFTPSMYKKIKELDVVIYIDASLFDVKSDYFNYVIKVLTYLFLLWEIFLFIKKLVTWAFFESLKKIVEMVFRIDWKSFQKTVFSTIYLHINLNSNRKNRSLNKYVGNQAPPEVFMLIRSLLVPLRCVEPPP